MTTGQVMAEEWEQRARRCLGEGERMRRGRLLARSMADARQIRTVEFTPDLQHIYT
jgi:hypothetical protein